MKQLAIVTATTAVDVTPTKTSASTISTTVGTVCRKIRNARVRSSTTQKRPIRMPIGRPSAIVSAYAANRCSSVAYTSDVQTPRSQLLVNEYQTGPGPGRM